MMDATKCHRLRSFFDVNSSDDAVCANCRDLAVNHADAPCPVLRMQIGSRCPKCGRSAADHSVRERLPDEREGVTHHFVITYLDRASNELRELDGYIQTGEYPDGRLGEIFIKLGKQGEELSGLMDGFATVFSIALQSGADLSNLCSKMIATQFEPAGPTRNPEISKCTSILDYIGRWISSKYVKAPIAVAVEESAV